MRVTAKAVRNNWQYNFAMAAGLAIWFVFACIILIDPKGSMEFATRLGKFKGMQSPWILAILSFVPAFLLALPFGGIGRIFGIRAASRILSELPREPAPGDLASPFFSSGVATGVRQLQSDRWMPQSRPTRPDPSPEGPPRGTGVTRGSGVGRLFLRLVFGVVWMVVFFVVGAISISAVAMALENGDQEARQKAAEAAGRASGVPLFFGSIILVVVLAMLGWLPGFRRRKADSPAADVALPRTKPSDSRPIVAR
jgi:hypothetical protein